MDKLSIIIPTLNEETNIQKLLERLHLGGKDKEYEILVSDGGSTDATVQLVKGDHVQLVTCSHQGRAFQMNKAAELARGDVLYFVHGDTLPPVSYYDDIQASIDAQYDMGCFRFRFDSGSPLLKINGFFTRFNLSWVRGGDQSLFVKKKVFDALGHFKEAYVIMEDFDFLKRAKGRYRFRILQNEIVVSSRKYQNNSYLRVQFANLVVFNMFRLGFAPQLLLKTYRVLINYRS